MVVLAVKHDIYRLTVSLVKCQEKEKSRGICIENYFQEVQFVP